MSLNLLLNNLKIKIGNNDTNIISSKLEIGQITNFTSILLIPIILFPSSLTLINHSHSSCLLILMLFYKSTYFRGWHYIPTTIRTNNNEFVCLLDLEVLNLWLWDQTDTLGLQITQRTCDSDSRTLLISPNTWGTYLLTLMSQAVDLSTGFFYSLTFVGADRLVVVG